ncbi:oxidoreductase [Virgisporangium aliadipatigenens]|uniref:Oxidoreductase n=1 Tax=Virgisporangium aliadipatigenens TaxID=741659 RepID=A0A8J3YPU6_9ACTN|nr:oxidoreductase [Virgisporangium aliadipatigenens]
MARAFAAGAPLDLSGHADREVRAEVLRGLLIGGPGAGAEPLPALRLTGAIVRGQLSLVHADVAAVVSLEECSFEAPPDLHGAHLRRLNLARSTFPGMVAWSLTVDGNVRLSECRSTAEIRLVGADIGGTLNLDGAELDGDVAADVPALNATGVRVGGDLRAEGGFVSRAEIRLNTAVIGGAMRWEGARIQALFAPDLSVGAIADLCEGFTATGEVHLAYAAVRSRLCFDNAVLKGRLVLRHLETRELFLATAGPPPLVDLSHARIGVLRDDPPSWPPVLHQDGLSYDSIAWSADRLAWLRRDPRGYRPHAYGQLAQAYRREGRLAAARAVLLAGERHRRSALPWGARLWGLVQDWAVGYGYLPARAAGWLAALVVLGTAVFRTVPPAAVEPGKAPPFHAVMYALDLLLPLIDFGQERAFVPRDGTEWLAYALTAAGWILATTIAAGATRALRRE